ncbi:PAS domain-containing protein [Rhizobium alvei]|uniref:PAS domain-containing protein n=1 Tax=Rhizobium alvei TaxID=1132659 RepID=A0ABT8YKZ8_9HYPH|nr:PAS domain-containing protein [Rhizobium alvei]MDO6964307.1 PAS domain-containing protein [Rhizobium alvei]
MELHLDDSLKTDGRADRLRTGVSDAELIELASSFRRFGFWRASLDTGHCYMSGVLCGIFNHPLTSGPIDQTTIRNSIHPDDVAIVYGTMEEAARERSSGHVIYRVRSDDGGYRPVRTVYAVREQEGSAGEIIGITYDLYVKQPTLVMVEPTS